jgi:hypothetical protein
VASVALELYIQPCIRSPPSPYHSPPLNKPLRISIEGPTIAIQRLFPEVKWNPDLTKEFRDFPQPAGPLLAALTFEKIFGRKVSRPEEMIVRSEYIGWTDFQGFANA